MNKKYLVFGLMGLFMVAIVAAALVPLLSNTVEKDIAVESPLILDGGDFTIGIEGYDFGIQTIDFTLHNNAVVPVHTIVETSIAGESEGNAFSDGEELGEEFAALEIGILMGDGAESLCTGDGGIWSPDTQFYCYWDASFDRSFTGVESGVYYVQMGSGDVPIGAGEDMYGRMKVQFDPAITPDTYTFTTAAVTIAGAKVLD